MDHSNSRVTNVRQKDTYYGIQDPATSLYARITGDAPAKPEPAEDATGSVAQRHSHIRFEPWERATWFKSHGQAETVFASHIGVSTLEIVRRDA